MKTNLYMVSIDDRKLKFVLATCEEHARFQCRHLGLEFKVTKFSELVWFVVSIAFFSGLVLFAGLV